MATTEEQEIMVVPSNVRKTSKGRQKIEIKKISKQNNRQVTFSKRRKNLFKKASELSSIGCNNARVVVFALSEKGRPYEYGNPDLINQFLATSDNDSNTPQHVPMISTEKSFEELESYRDSLLEMRANLESRIHEVMITRVKSEVVVDDQDALLGFDYGADGTLGNNIYTTFANDYHNSLEEKPSFDVDQQWTYLPPLIVDEDDGISGNFSHYHQWSYLPGFGDDFAVDGFSGNQWSYGFGEYDYGNYSMTVADDFNGGYNNLAFGVGDYGWANNNEENMQSFLGNMNIPSDTHFSYSGMLNFE